MRLWAALILLFAFCMLWQYSYSTGYAGYLNSGSGIVRAGPLSNSLSVYSPMPKSNMAGLVYVVTASGTMLETISALSGLVARTVPQIYVQSTPQDLTWLKFAVSIFGSLGLKYQTSTVSSLMLKFSNVVSTTDGKYNLIEYASDDPLFPLQSNIAKTLSGVYSALPVSSADMATVSRIYSGKVNVLYDLSSMGFTSKLDGYSWLWNLTRNQVNTQVLASSPNGRYQLTDYIVEFKLYEMEFGAGSISSQDQAFVESVLSSYPALTWVLGMFGFGGEVQTINLVSSYGDLFQVLDLVPNMSFWSGMYDIAGLTQSTPTYITYQKGDTYVSFAYTQGDAYPFDFYGNLPKWDQVDPNTHMPYRYEVPVTFQLNPVLADMASPILIYWFDTMGSSDYFITGPSGGAYVHPDQMGQYEQAYLAYAGQADQQNGFNGLFVILGTPDQSNLQKVSNEFGGTLNAMYLWQDNGHAFYVFNNDVPAIYPAFWISDKNASVSKTVSEIEALSSRGTHFLSVEMNTNAPDLGFVKQVLDDLPSQYIGVRADQLASVYLQSTGK